MAKVRRKAGWHPEQIKAQIRMTGWSLDGLSRACGLPPHCVRHAIRMPNLPGETVIVALLGIPPGTLWPDRYDADGVRTARSRAGQIPNLEAIARHCEKRVAA